MKPAVRAIGWLATMTLSAWLGWWFVSHDPESLGAPLTLPLGAVVVLAWGTGTVLVWRHPWGAAVVFAATAGMPLASKDALPSAALLVAMSAALAVWSLLAIVSPYLVTTDQTHAVPAAAGDVEGTRTRESRQCLICHGSSVETLCAGCAAALGEQRVMWSASPTPTPPWAPITLPTSTPESRRFAVQ